MQGLELGKTAGDKFAIVANPLTGLYVEVPKGADLHIYSGQPVVVYTDTKAEGRDQLFSAWTEDADGKLDTYTEREISVSTNYTEADAETTATEAMDAASGLLTRPIKHPDREEWGMIVSAHILSGVPAGSKKDGLMGKHLAKLNKGHNKTKKSAKSDGWR